MVKEELIERCLRRAVETEEIAGACVLVMEHGEEKYYLQAGWACKEKRMPIRRNTLYRLFSMSKPVTAAAIMILMEEGLIDLYEPVSKFIRTFEKQKVAAGKSLVPVDRDMTIRDLLSMTSGLSYPGNSDRAEEEIGYVYEELEKRSDTRDAFTTMEFAEKIGKCPLAFQPGTFWKYGVSADILGAVIEKVSDMDFGNFLQERIFIPLRMKDTGFILSEDKQKRLACVYERKEEKGLCPFLQNHLGIKMDARPNPFESGGAGLFSTADDYAKFAQMLLNDGMGEENRILRKESVRYLTGCGLDGTRQDAFSSWFGLDGHTYGNLMHVLQDRKIAGVMGNEGEYGWDGWLGTYFVNDPHRSMTYLFMTQMKDYGTGNLTRKIKNIIYC